MRLTGKMLLQWLSWASLVHSLAILPDTSALEATDSPGGEAGRRRPVLNYLALGDSYSSGTGSGQFLNADENPKDGKNNNICARMTKSYPWYLQDLMGRRFNKTDFISCSGNVLDDIDKQVKRLKGERYDIVTLSIIGNDFEFGNGVANCVYRFLPTVNFSRPLATELCNQALIRSEGLIKNETNWAKYRAKLALIQKDVLAENGIIYVTGYAKFFSPRGHTGDKCDTSCFIHANPATQALLCAIDMKWTTRQTMNRLSDYVNMRIKRDVVGKYDERKGGKAVFVDIDEHFEGHRFCEPGKEIWGRTQEDVYFYEIGSRLDEWGPWDGPASENDPWADGYLGDPNFGRGILDPYQQSSVFHPKSRAHALTALKIGRLVAQWLQNGSEV